MSISAPGRRIHCPQCLRPAAACICHCVHRVDHHTQVLLLQHPMEATHPKGTARLLHLCLPHSRMEVGEAWPATEWQALLHGAWCQDSLVMPAPVLTLLLYPPSPPDPGLPLQTPPDWDMGELAKLPQGAPLRLVVLDGTWRKSRKMLYLNPALQRLPRLPLHHLPESRYTIRKAHLPGQLSTLEATWAALRQLEPGQPGLDKLLQAMTALQQQYLHRASGSLVKLS